MSEHDRTQGIGGTDARLIMAGQWLPLWLEKTGQRPPQDLTDVFRVQLGRFTEPLHLSWIARRQEIDVQYLDLPDGGRIHDPAMPWRWITLDGWDNTNSVPIEVKHSHSGVNARTMADYYMPQLQHCMSIVVRPWMWFSVIPGNDEPLTVKVEADADYIEKLLEAERQFWWHVTEHIRPDLLPHGALDRASLRVEQVLVGGYKGDLDMSRDNTWAMLAGEYHLHKPSARFFEAACVQLKEALPDDRRRCFGNGVQVVRDKRGRLSIREHDHGPAD